MMPKRYPDWLGAMLFSGELSFERMAKFSLSEFLSLYSLHDSYFITLHIAPGHYAVAALKWYTGLESPVFDPPMKDDSYAFLLIYFPYLYQLRLGQDAVSFPYIVDAAESIVLTDEQRLARLSAGLHEPLHDDSHYEFLLEPPVCVTTFIGVENTRLDITHGEAVYFGCLDDDGQIHSLPGFAK